MLSSLNNWLAHNAKVRLILLLLGLFLLFSLVVMPFGQKWLGGNADQVGLIDLTFAAAPAKLFEKVESYGEQGRHMYSLFALTADIAYPIIYSIFLGLSITYLLRKNFSTESNLQKLNLLPFAAMLFDILENLCIVTLLATYPQQIKGLAFLTIIMNFIKWVFAGASTLLVLIGLVILVLKNRIKSPKGLGNPF